MVKMYFFHHICLAQFLTYTPVSGPPIEKKSFCRYLISISEREKKLLTTHPNFITGSDIMEKILNGFPSAVLSLLCLRSGQTVTKVTANCR